MSESADEKKFEIFELGTVDDAVAKFGGKKLKEEITYVIPAIPMFGEPCANQRVLKSHELTHPAIYSALVSEVKIIGSAAFPIIQNKSICHQYFSTQYWETSEQATLCSVIREDQNVIGYCNITARRHYEFKIINLVGNGSYNYAHWMTEFLPQLVLLKQDGVDLSAYKIVIDSRSYPSMLEALFLLGITEDQLIKIEPMSLNDFPEALWVSPVANIVFQRPNAISSDALHQQAEPQHAIFHPDALVATRNTFLALAAEHDCADAPERIFIKRFTGRQYHARAVVNEVEIEKKLGSEGFVSIDPSTLSFTEQIRMFSKAKYIVSASGAALLNMIWAPVGAKIIVLMNDAKVVNYWYFSNIAYAVGHQLSYILGKAVNTGNWDDINHADFIIDPNLLDHVLGLCDRGAVTDSYLASQIMLSKSSAKLNKIRVLFVLQYAQIWTSLRSVYQSLSASDNLDVKVLKSEFIHASASDDNMMQLDLLCHHEKIDAETNVDSVLSDFQPHVVFVQNPYDSTRVQALQSYRLVALGIRVAYVPYGIEMGGGLDNIQYQFNSEVQQLAWRVFVRSSRNKAMYAKHCDVGDSHVVVTGHPKFDAQLDIDAYIINPKLKAKIAGRPVVLWTPHFSVGLPASWSTYRIYNQVIMQQTLARQDVFFIIRPHPLFFKEMLRQHLWGIEGEAEFRSRCDQQDNLWLDETADYTESFYASNAIMTDVGSFLLEYLPTKKPILYLHHPQGLGLNDDADLVEHYYRADKPDDIPNYIDMVSKGLDLMKEKRTLIQDEFLFGLDGSAGQRIAKYLIDELTLELDITDCHAEADSEITLQNKTDLFWKNTPTLTYEADGYFQAKIDAYKKVLRFLPRLTNVVDAGCGNGAYTIALAAISEKVYAYDISQKIINFAQKRAETVGSINIDFSVLDFRMVTMPEALNLVSSNEFLSSILDDTALSNIMNQIARKLNINGYLLIIDRFSLEHDKLFSYPSGLTLKLRNIDAFHSYMRQLGFNLQFQDIFNKSTSDESVFCLSLMKKLT